MKILGIGVDIIENKRIKLLLNNKKFLSRTFSKKEIKFSNNISNKANFFAKRFSAKEAFAKCLGTGFRYDLNMKDIEILNNKEGKPYYYKSKKINDVVNRRFQIKNYNLFLSISDEKDYSIAFTLLETK
tara:strand:- start:283 stop:669 length:387 start_codon:yes stop_codon:yes gene_type:complete